MAGGCSGGSVVVSSGFSSMTVFELLSTSTVDEFMKDALFDVAVILLIAVDDAGGVVVGTCVTVAVGDDDDDDDDDDGI